MREIKFRAWDFERKEMFIPDEFVFDFNINSLYQIDRMAIESVLMQYTGLKDKNNKEIYEDDIIEGEWALFYAQPKVRGIIKFDENTLSFIVKGIKGLYKNNLMPLFQFKNISIIGNRYEVSNY